MTKVPLKPGTMIYPLPAVMVSCGSTPEEYNIVTVAWTGTICTNPPMCYISLRPERFSYDIIKQSNEFVINLTPSKLAFATDWCGIKTGREVNKFKNMNLTPQKGQVVNAPLIAESPLNIECQVTEIKMLGSHHMFIAEVVAINADESLMDPQSGAFRLNDSKLVCYSHGKYFEMGKFIGKFGFSVEKKKKKQSPGKKKKDNA